MIGTAGWGLDQRARSARLGTSSAEGSVPSRPFFCSAVEPTDPGSCSADLSVTFALCPRGLVTILSYILPGLLTEHGNAIIGPVGLV
jgi:hypothetical protein